MEIGNLTIKLCVKTGITFWEVIKIKLLGKRGDKLIDEMINRIKNIGADTSK